MHVMHESGHLEVPPGRSRPADSEGRFGMAQAASASAQRAAVRRKQRANGASRRPTGPSGIRWDRVARAALLGTLAVVLLLYISPLHRWVTQRHLASRQQQELQTLQQQNKQLKSRISDLRNPTALELEARKLGMVRRGEREYVIENPPGH